MKKTLLAITMSILVLSGCASVPMESDIKSNLAKEFKSPPSDISGIYIYRENTVVGAALKKDIWIDKECIGETAKGVFFYHEVEGDQDHTVSTESEFSPNNLIINTKSGTLYFVEQYIKLGMFVGGADLKQKDAETGRQEVSKLKMAKKGRCSP